MMKTRDLLGRDDPPPTPLAELRDLTRIALFAALVGAGAFIHIPFGPLFLSLQTMMLMLTGFMLGPRKAALAILLYLACGFIGLPVFGRGRSGPASFLGPTAGYFPGFLLGTVIAGLSVHCRRSRASRIGGMILFGSIGTVGLLLCGALWLGHAVYADMDQALAFGFYAFLPGDMLKMLAAVAVREAFFSRDGEAEP